VFEPLVYVVLHKPRGVVCTLKDPEGRPTVGEHLRRVEARVVPAGRLDFHTSGALICSNDGDFVERLAHPRHHVPKEYVAKVHGIVDEAGLSRLREELVIEGRATRPAQVRILRVEGDKTWLTVRLMEGRNRQVRRLGEHAGLPVLRLVRVAQAGITVEGLRPGEWRHLTIDELRVLQSEYGVPRRVRAPEPDRLPRQRAPVERPRRARAGSTHPLPPSSSRSHGGRSRPRR
jgi:23S rRNA pseudouridine2605 synthase